MRNELKRAIKFRSTKIRKKKLKKSSIAAEYRRKFERRTGLPAGIAAVQPEYIPDRQFDIDHVARKASLISWAIWRAAQDGTYSPVPALLHRIDKVGTVQKREIMEFSIADAALASVLNKRLLGRNLKRFSGNSFSYRPDRNQFDAIINLKQYLAKDKVFVIQFDFEKYFDSIPHAYIKKIINNFGIISASSVEKRLLEAFLMHKYALKSRYNSGLFTSKSKVGSPQGSSVSLFVANLANDALDKRIEGVNGQFVRYADDVVAIASTYEDALRIEQCFHDHCRESGLKINFDKSDGIRLLSPAKVNEIATINKFKFLGYDFYNDGCAISERSVKRIKTKISRLIHIYLIQYPDKFGYSPKRALDSDSIPFYDWDLMGLVSELRNYLYGGCSENQINQLLYQGRRIPPMRGLMSFYALVDKKENLRELDGWLVNSLRSALNKRRLILLKKYGKDYPRFSNEKLIKGTWYDPLFNEEGVFEPDSRLPSFVRGWRAARKYYLTFGLDDVSPPPYTGY